VGKQNCKSYFYICKFHFSNDGGWLGQVVQSHFKWAAKNRSFRS